MRILFMLIIATTVTSLQAQVRYVVVCNDQTQKIEVIKDTEFDSRTGITRLSGNDFPTRAIANDWKKENYQSDDCASVRTVPAAPPVTPSPAGPPRSDIIPPPEKRVTHINDSRVAIFGTVLFDAGDWQTPVSGGADFIPFTAGFNWKNGNKAKFGFETVFQGWGKVAIPGDDPRMLATATLSFLFAYPVAMDKQGRFWVVPEAGIGVDFFDLFQIGDEFNTDQKFAAPSFFLRVGVEMYHVRPFFYYGRTMIDVYENFSLKPNHIGTGLAIVF